MLHVRRVTFARHQRSAAHPASRPSAASSESPPANNSLQRTRRQSLRSFLLAAELDIVRLLKGMQNLYCWRCNAEMPMLDETEFEVVSKLLSEGFTATKEFRERFGLSLADLSLKERFVPALDAYFRITGFRESNPNALWHHRLSLYGPSCPGCGRPLRTPRAQLCPACGWSPGVASPP